MSWARLDDGYFDHPKIAALSDAAQLAHVRSIVYCARNLTDGHLPIRKAREFATPRAIKELTPSLWEPISDGFTVHDYLEYNPTREKVLQEREKARSRMQGVRSRPVRPNNTPNKSRSSPAPDPDPQIKQVSDLHARANRVAVNPDLDTTDDPPFTKAFREHFQQREGKDPPRNQLADARELDRTFPPEECIQVAQDYEWGVAPKYLMSVLTNRKEQSNGRTNGRYAAPQRAATRRSAGTITAADLDDFGRYKRGEVD